MNDVDGTPVGLFYRSFPIDWQGNGVYVLRNLEGDIYRYERLQSVQVFEDAVRYRIPLRFVLETDLNPTPDLETT